MSPVIEAEAESTRPIEIPLAAVGIMSTLAASVRSNAFTPAVAARAEMDADRERAVNFCRAKDATAPDAALSVRSRDEGAEMNPVTVD